MRGPDYDQSYLFCYVSPEAFVPDQHPLRPIRIMVDDVLARLSTAFGGLYSPLGRPSVPPEQLIRALLLQLLFSIRSERMLMEQLRYNLLFRWFVGLQIEEAVWDATVFSKNRERLIKGDIAQQVLEAVVTRATDFNLCRMSILRWTGRYWRRGRARRVTNARTTRRIRAVEVVERSYSVTGLSRRPIRTRKCIARVRAGNSSCVTWPIS